ncbi:MBL fold metallo-hydrolase [Thermoanaerobacterium sp. DL9XJH110]|uniref:MBL fold metallo-hydrolase n=1 Tax=Thermoanaerobacterium sp. DL9XJH110 TaxID=3386643 RepID=UPI003BB6850D
MELIKLRGHTYYIHSATNVGVYRYRNGFCTLIDSGIDNTAGKHLLEVLEAEKLKVKYIVNTHAHPDHFGADDYIRQNHTGTRIAASKREKLFMENNSFEGMVFYGASPIPGLSAKFVKARETFVDIELAEGPVELGDKKFEIVPLKGHTLDQIGVATEDNVLFCGDAFFSEEKMAKYPLPFIFDVSEHLKTLEYLLTTDYDYYVISHSEKPLQDPAALIRKNIDNIQDNINLMLEYLSQPLTREDLAELIIKKYMIPMNVPQYFITLTSVSAFLTYLLEKNSITMDIIDGKMYFYV